MDTQVISLIIGIIFGSALVLAGLSNPDPIIKSLRLSDKHVIRTVIVLLLVALIGTWLITMLGTVKIEIKPAAIITLIIGGLLFGAGIGFTGYTPGTSLASAASGRIDAIFAILGMLFGAYVYIFLYPPAIKPIETVDNFGKVTLPEITHIPEVFWIIVVSATGSIALILTRVIGPHKRVAPAQQKESVINEISFQDETLKPAKGEAYFSINTDFFDTAQMLNLRKNILFFIIIICLLLLQVIFWLVNAGNIEYNEQILTNAFFPLTFVQLGIIINICNTVLMFAGVLYALTIFFCLSASFSANLGSLRYICRAFFSAIIALFLLVPWQLLFGQTLFGVIYTPSELIQSNNSNINQTFPPVLLYLRFVGYWAFAAFLLIRSYIYSHKWIKSLLDRIEQIL